MKKTPSQIEFSLSLLVILYKNERGIIMAKKKKPIILEELTREEKMKYEIAEELGLLDKVMNEGWKSLTSKETGRIGGILARKRRKEKETQEK